MNSSFSLIRPEQIEENPFTLLDKDWMLITAGTTEKYNSMTASWGGFGVLWNKKVVFTFIRPTRYTFEFTERESLFTLSFFGNEHKKALEICGRKSGRDLDKIKESGLTPLISGNYIAFSEAKLVLQCTKLYHNDLLPEHFLNPKIESNYPLKDYHRMYIGEIDKAWLKK